KRSIAMVKEDTIDILKKQIDGWKLQIEGLYTEIYPISTGIGKRVLGFGEAQPLAARVLQLNIEINVHAQNAYRVALEMDRLVTPDDRRASVIKKILQFVTQSFVEVSNEALKLAKKAMLNLSNIVDGANVLTVMMELAPLALTKEESNELKKSRDHHFKQYEKLSSEYEKESRRGGPREQTRRVERKSTYIPDAYEGAFHHYDNAKDPSRIFPGDLLEIRSMKVYKHWAVVVEVRDGEVIIAHALGGRLSASGNNFGISSALNGTGKITEETLAAYLQRNSNCRFRVNNGWDAHWEPKHFNEIILRAKIQVDLEKYNALFANCEHFANDCRYGRKYSSQVIGV
ncbi:hypothetical protein PENTCL1PPCAC_3977, partial [Pristionchus entomophagus]